MSTRRGARGPGTWAARSSVDRPAARGRGVGPGRKSGRAGQPGCFLAGFAPEGAFARAIEGGARYSLPPDSLPRGGGSDPPTIPFRLLRAKVARKPRTLIFQEINP